VARAAGAGPVVDCDDPAVEIALFQAEDSDIVLVLSHDVAPRTATLSTERMVASVSDVRGGPAAEIGAKSFGVPLGPNGTAALKLTYGG